MPSITSLVFVTKITLPRLVIGQAIVQSTAQPQAARRGANLCGKLERIQPVFVRLTFLRACVGKVEFAFMAGPPSA